jgi:hypothetical protein
LSEDQIHAGYEFESGMFSRIRSWIDLAPWVRLVRVLRLLASPSCVLLAALASFVTGLGGRTLLGIEVFDGAVLDAINGMRFWQIPAFYWEALINAAVRSPVRAGVFAVMMALLWTPLFQCFARLGAELTAGHSLSGIGAKLTVCRRRGLVSYLVPLIPWLCIAAFGMLLFLIRLPSVLLPWSWVSTACGVAAGLMAIPIGVLGFGAWFAIPLGLVAMVCEPDPDPIDSLSRGYEYFARRPFSLAWYGVVGSVLILLASIILIGIISVSLFACRLTGWLVQPDLQFAAAAEYVLTILLFGWIKVLGCGLFGGVYLLLRRDASGQHVEELWFPVEREEEPLPSLPKEAFES